MNSSAAAAAAVDALLAQAPQSHVQTAVEGQVTGVGTAAEVAGARDVVLAGAVVDEADGVAAVEILRRSSGLLKDINRRGRAA